MVLGERWNCCKGTVPGTVPVPAGTVPGNIMYRGFVGAAREVLHTYYWYLKHASYLLAVLLAVKASCLWETDQRNWASNQLESIIFFQGQHRTEPSLLQKGMHSRKLR